MNSITAVIIAKNEEDIIGDCLRSLDFVNKRIVIDCYSTDDTIKVAKKYNTEVVKVKFSDFSQIRNAALNFVKTKWILYVDADERINSELKQNIQKVIETDISAVCFYRKNFYLGKPWPYLETLIRLFQKEKLIKWTGKIHESPVYDGSLTKINGELLHYTHRTIKEMFVKTIQWSIVEAQIRYDVNHPPVTWWRLIRVYITGFYNSYIKERGFKVGPEGLVESLYQGFSMYITYLRLWELQKNTKK